MKPQRSQSICLINFVKVTYSPSIVPTSEKCYACNILRNTTYVPIKLFLQCHLWNLTDVMTTCAVYFSFTSDVGKDYNVHQHFMIDKQLYLHFKQRRYLLSNNFAKQSGRYCYSVAKIGKVRHDRFSQPVEKRDVACLLLDCAQIFRTSSVHRYKN